ncbi:pyruvate kinase [Blastopirellula marina]|uniref:Pyruvate kinase n=1 Tax=Blastopirellula marina TaxID=124 RepID=A0A2S8G9Z5_9BACT|nr:pyruvate kinase [Blastopirellula marina]PQO41130.1 hypothetical protein C5Y98_04010 [Blastopirellula marina]PTL46006.1 hypothetical protein C5Y97_04010 [Blastopirellula marina]
MLKRTKVAATIGPSCCQTDTLENIVRAGADACLLDLTNGSREDWQTWYDVIREVEGLVKQPVAILARLNSDNGNFSLEDAVAAGVLDWISQQEIEYVTTSASQGSRSIQQVREALDRAGSQAAILARLDNGSNYRDIDSIIQASDGVIVTSTGLSELEKWSIPVMQKMVARQCQIGAKPCVVQRGVLSSMRHALEPTDGEVFDIANIVFDHADAILLGNETATGDYPTEAVEVVSKTVIATESLMEITDRPIKVGFGQPPNTAALAYSIRHILKMQEIAAVGVYSQTTATAGLIAKNWIDCPILALSNIPTTVRQMGIYHGVVSRQMKAPTSTAEMLTSTTSIAKQIGLVAPGDRMIVVSELPLHTGENANAFVIETIR